MKQKIPALFISFMLVFTLAGCTAEKDQPSAYAQAGNWAYLEVDKTTDADVFFICPTVYGGDEDSFNMPMDDEDAKSDFLGAANMEKGIYDSDARFFAPYYRQAGLNVYELPAEDREEYLARAYADIKDAFLYYLEHCNNGRPIILAGFSQGGDMSIRLLKDCFAEEEVNELLVACYAIGWSVSEEDLEQITDMMGSYTTNYKDSGQNRCDNISNATSKINGTLLYPGEEFSVYEAIGPLDAANGYELAGAYENGQTVESYGGGVCQVSTTLYNAVILAELEITQRSNHSMIVSYVKPSMDAAIAGDYKDLRFVNNQDIPIYIEGYTEGKNVTFKIYGHDTRPSNRVVTYESEVVSEQDPGTQYVATGDPAGYMKPAQGKHIGYVARLWKVVTVDGVEESREIFNKSTYKASPKIVNVGPASADPNVSAVIGAALATGDEATINAAVAPYAASAAAILNPAPVEQPSQEEQAITGTVDESQITGGE